MFVWKSVGSLFENSPNNACAWDVLAKLVIIALTPHPPNIALDLTPSPNLFGLYLPRHQPMRLIRPPKNKMFEEVRIFENNRKVIKM